MQTKHYKNFEEEKVISTMKVNEGSMEDMVVPLLCLKGPQ